nr:PREDICTED: golgin subfamily B member 1-like isoform X2 [Lepisosteus oculatus]
MWKWYSGDESAPGQGAPAPPDGMSSQSVADITEQLAQTEQLVVQLKELIREKDNVLRTKDEQLKTEKEAWEAKLSKMKLQNKAKVTSLNSQLEELKKQLPSSGAKETKSDIRKASGDGDQEHAAASRGKILVLKKKVEELELQLSQKEADLEVKTRELADQRQRGAEMDGMLAERDKKLQEKEAYIVDLQLSASADLTSRASSTPTEPLKVHLAEKDGSLQDLQVLVQNLTKKVGESEEKFSLLQEQNESLKELLMKEKTQFEEKEKMYKENIQTFKDIILEKDNKLVEINQMHEQELFRLAAKSDASADLEQLLKALKQKLHEKEEVLLGKTQVIDVLQNEVDARDQQIKELAEKMKRLQGEKDNMLSKLDAEKHVMRAQLRDLMQKHETELKQVTERHESELSEKHQAYLQLQRQLQELSNKNAAPAEQTGGTPLDTAANQKMTELEAQAKQKTEEASKSETKFLKMKAWSKSRIKQLEEELRKAQSGNTSPDVNALRNRIADLEEEREELHQKLEQYEELKMKNDELMAKLVIYEEQQRKMQADLEQVTKRAASQTSESGSVEELQSQVLEWQEMVSEAEAVRDQAREEKTAMVLRMSQIEEEREGLIEDDWFFPGCSDPALVARQQELEEELAQARGLRQQRGKQKQVNIGTHNLQEDFEFDGKQSYEDASVTLESNNSAEGENMGGLRSVVEELELERNQLQEQILALEERCQDLEDRLQLQARIESLQVTFDVDEEGQPLRVTQNETERLQAQLASVRSQQSRDAEKHQILVSSLNEQLKGMSDRKETLETSLMEKEQTLAKTSVKLELIDHLKDSLKVQEVQNKEITEKLFHTEQKLSEASKKCNSYEKQCSELKTSVTDLTQKLSMLKEKSQKQEATIETLQRDLDQTNDELDKLNSAHLQERAQLIHDLQSCEREIDNLKDVLLEKEKEISSLSSSMNEYAEQVLELKQQIKYKEEDLALMESALAKVEQEARIIRDSQSSDQQALNAKIAALMEQLKSMENELDSIKAQKEEKVREAEELLKHVQEDRETIQDLRSEIQKQNVNHRTHLAECESQISSLREQVTATSQKLQESDNKSQAEISDLLSRLEESSAFNKELKDKLQEKEQTFANELKSLKEECNKLLAEVSTKDKELQKLSEQLAEQVEHHEKIKKVVQEKLETISSLEQNLKTTQQEAEYNKQKQNEELEARVLTCKTLEDELCDKSENLSKLEIDVKNLEHAKEELQAIVEEKEKLLEAQKQLVAELSEKVAVAAKDNKDLQVQVHKFTEESEKLRKAVTDQERYHSEEFERQKKVENELQSKLSHYETQISEYCKTVGMLQKEKEDLTLKTEDLNILEQNKNIVAEKLLEKNDECSHLAQLLSESKESIAHFQEQINILNSQLDQLKCDIAEKEKVVQDKNAQCEFQQEQLGQLQETLILLQEQSAVLKSCLLEKDSVLQQRALECEASQNEIVQQKELFDKLKIEMESLKGQCIQQNQNLNEKEITLNNKSQECQGLLDKINRKDETVTSLSRQLDVTNEELIKLQSENVNLKTTLDNTIADCKLLKEDTVQSKNEVMELQKQVQALNEQNAKLEIEIKEAAVVLSETLKEIGDLQSELSSRESSIVFLKEEVVGINSERLSLNVALQEKIEALNQQEIFIKQLQTKSIEGEGQLSQNMVTITELQIQVQELQTSLQDRGNLLKKQEKELTRLKDKAEESEVLKTQLNENMEIISNLQIQLQAMSEKNDELNHSIIENDSLLKQKIDDYLNLRAQFSELEDMVSQLKKQLHSTTTESDQLKKVLKEKELTISQIQKSLVDLGEDFNLKLKAKETECGTFKEQITDLQESVAKLNEKISTQSSEISQLKEVLLEKETSVSDQARILKELQIRADEAVLFKSQLLESREFVSQLQDQILKLSTESKRLSESSEEKSSAFLNLQDMYASQSERLRECNTLITQKEEEISNLSKLLSENRESRYFAENTSNLLKNEITLLRDELQQIQTSYVNNLKQKDDVLLTYQANNSCLTAEIEQLKPQYQKAIQQVQTLNESLEQREADLQSLKREHSEQVDHIDLLKSEILDLNQKNKKMREEAEQVNHNLQQQLDLIVSEKTHLQQEVERITLEKVELDKNYNSQLQTMKNEMDFINKQHVSNMSEAAEQLTTEKELLQMQVSAKIEEIIGLKLETRNIEHTLQESEKEWLSILDRETQLKNLLTEQLRSLENEMKSKDVKVQALQKDLDTLQEKFNEVTSALKISTEQLKESCQQIAVDKHQLENVFAAIQRKDGEISELQQHLRDREDEVKMLEIDKESSNKNLFEISQSMSDKLVAFEEEKKYLQATIKQIKVNHQAEMDSMKASLDNVTEVLQEKQSELAEREKIYQEKNNQLCFLQDQIKNLQKDMDAAATDLKEAVTEHEYHLGVIKKKEDQIQCMNIQISQQKELLTSLSQQLREKDASVTQVMVSASNEMLKYSDEKNRLISQVENLEHLHHCSTKELEELSLQLQECKSQLSLCQNQIEIKDVEKQELVKEKELMQVQYEKLSKDKEIMKKKLQAALLVRKDLIKKVEELEKQREGGDQQDKEMSELQDQLQELKLHLQTTTQEHESHVDLLKEQILQKESGILKLSEALSMKESLLEQLEHNVQCLQRKLSEQETDIFPALQSINEKDKVIEHLQYSISEKEESYNSERAEMIKKLENLRAELLKKEESIQLIDSVNSNIEQVDSMASEDTELTQIKQEKDILQKKLHAALLARKETIKKSQEKERKHANELSDLKEEFNKLMEQYSEQTHELNAMQKKYDEKIKESEDNLQVIASLQSQLSSISNVVNEKEKALQEFDLLLKEHEMSEQAALQNQGELETLKKKIEVMTSEMAGKEILLQTIQDRSKVLTQKIEQIEQELEKAHFEIREKAEELMVQQQAMKVAQQQYQQEKKLMADESSELQNQLRTCQTEIDHLTVALENVKREKECQLEDLSNANQLLLDTTKDIKEELEKAHKIHSEKLKELQDMKNILAETQHNFSQEKECLKVELENLRSCWKVSQAETENCKLHIETLEKENDDLSSVLERFKGEVVTLEEKLNKTNKLKEDTLEKLLALEAQKSKEDSTFGKETLLALQSQNQNFEARLQDKEGILLSLKLTISEKDDLIAALEQQLQKELHLHEVEREKMEIEINELQQKSNARQVKEQSEEGKSNNEQITRKLQAALISRKEALKENRTLKEKIQLLSSEKEDIMNTTLSLERSAAEMKRQKEDLELSMLSLSKEKEKLVLEVDQVLSDNHNLAAACESLKLTIENITQQKQAFSCQLESLKDSQTVELSEWKSKHTELKQEYESLLQAYENISSEMDKMRQLIEAARKEKQEVLSKWYKTASEKEILEKQVGEAEEENEKLKDKTRKFAKVKQQRILELEQENEKIKKELLELSEKQVGKAEELSSRNTQLEAENNRLKETYEELLVKLNEMKCANQKVTEELKVMSESLANCHSEYKAKEAEMERKLEETLSLNDLLTLEVETQKAVISAKCECLNVLEKEKCNLSDQLAQLIKDHQEKLEQKDSALAERQGVINRNVQETISLNEKVRILEDDKSLLQEELENVQETSDKVKNENEYLETVLLKNAEKIDELTETVNTLQVQNKSLSAQLIEIKQEKNEFCRQKEDQQLKLVKEFEEKLRVAQRGSAGSKSINKELQELLKEKHQEINQLQSDCINYQEVILDFERSAKVLQSEHSKVEKELNDTKEKLLNLETIIQNLESEITSYKNLLNESRNEVEKVNSEIVKLHNQLAQKDKLAELQLMEKEKELKELLEQQNTLHKEMLMELEARINTLQLEKEKDEETVFELKKQIESQGIMNSRLQKEANLNLSRLVAVSQSLRNNDEARQWEDKFQKLIQDKDGQLLEQSHAISRLKQDMKVKDALLNELKEKFLKLETALSETDTHYKAAASDYQKQVTIMEENNKELSKNIEDLRKQIGGQSDDIEKLQQDKSSLNLRLTDKLDYVSKMEANLTMLEMKLSNTEAELFLVRSQNDKLVVDLEKQDAISAQLKLLLKNKDAEIALLLSSREISEYLEEVQKHHWAEILGYEDRLSALYSERENADKAFRGLESNVKSLQEKYEKSLQEKEQMNAKLESFKKAMMSLQSDRDHLMSKYEVLQSKLQSIEKEKEILIKEELGETNKLKQEIKALLHQMDDLNSENAMLKAQLIRYREDLNQVLSLKDNQLKELLKQQLDSIKNLENQKNAMDKMYKDVLQNLEKETETTKSLEAKNSELGIQVQTLEANILALKKERQELNQNKVIADLQQAVEVKAAECSELHQKLFAQKSSVEDLKRNLRQLESDMEKKVKETKEKYNNEISAFEREVALMRSIRETAEERVEELTRDLIQTEQLLSEARSQSKELKSHNESLGKAMVALQNDRDQLIEDFKLLRNKYDEELKTASAALNKFEFQLNNMTSEVKMLTKERSALIQKLSAFESDSTYSQLMGQVDDLCKTVTEKEAEIKRLTLENETYSKQMTAFSKSMASLQDDRDRLIQQLGGTKRVYESRQRESSASSSVKSDKELDAFRSNFSELQTEKGSVVKEMGSQRLENVELTQMKIRVDELQKALQQAYAYRQQTEKDIRAYQSELGELRSEKNLLLSESRALRQQHLMVVAEKDRQISELQKHRPEALVKESKNAPSLYPVKMESVTLAAKEASADQVTQLLKERGQLQSDLQRCLQEIHQKDLRFQQLNAKMMQTIEEKMGLSMQLKAVSQTLRETQMNLSEVQNRCYWLESQTQTPAVLPYQNPVQGAAAVEVPPGAPQEKTMVDIESLDGSELRRRLIETEQALDSTQQDLSHLAEELSEERARREAAEEALGLVAESDKSIDANISRSTPREYSIQLESDEEHRALIIDPAEHVVVRKMKGGALSVKRWLRGRSLYCSKLLTTRAKSRYVFLTYLLALHVVVFMCLTGLL